MEVAFLPFYCMLGDMSLKNDGEKTWDPRIFTVNMNNRIRMSGMKFQQANEYH